MFLKVIIVLILIGYVFNKVVSFIFRGSMRGYTGRDQFGQASHTHKSRKAQNSNLHIDNIPNKRSKKEISSAEESMWTMRK